MLTVKHLSKVFENAGKPVPVLKDVNCEISKGEVISIIGPSGTGKSTLLRCLNRLEEPTGGQIEIDGEDILALQPEDSLSLKLVRGICSSFTEPVPGRLVAKIF